MIDLLLPVSGLVAIVDWLAVWRGWRRVGFLAKPLTIFLLLCWLVMRSRLQGPTLLFGIGLLFSLAGDIFLMFSPRYFMMGLISFSLVHLAYLAGFLIPFPGDGLPEVVALGVVISFVVIIVLRRIRAAQILRGSVKLVRPTMIYGTLISLMLLTAMWTLFRPEWSALNAILVSLGAILFYSSDLTNAWIRFVNPVRSGRVIVMVTYHIGQMLLIAGVVHNGVI